jgi:hypothetical protein
MPRTSSAAPLAALKALSDEPVSTSALYDRIGYVALMHAGMIPYRRLRAALAELEKEGLASSETGEDGETLWRRTPSGEQQQLRLQG